ncbi:MAG: TrkH family potassium uptake protein [Parvularculaceae bacterium]|nr:TrkH family potassium uptake protein [Parvularculaceae bacterium]
MVSATLARYFGVSLLLIGGAMAIPFVLALSLKDPAAGNYAFGLAVTLFAGAGFMVLGAGSRREVDFRSAIFLVIIWWSAAPLFAALPFWLGGWSPIDGYFESVSAVTTTGATLERGDLRTSPPALAWRAILQWIGGLVSLAAAAAIFIRPQFVGADNVEPTFSRGEDGSYTFAFKSALRVFAPVYGALTFIAFAVFALGGAPTFDSFVLALSCIASGGIVPHPDGLSAYSDAAAVAYFPFMVLSGASFILIVRAFSRKRTKAADVETSVYLLLSLLLALLFLLFEGDTVFASLFNAASLFSTNGIVIGAKPDLIFALVTVIIGGCAISTAGGLKILRWIVVIRRTQMEVRRLIMPSAVFGPRTTRNELGVWMHFLVFTMGLAVLTTALTAGGHSIEAAAAGAVGAVANAGPVMALTPEGHEGYHIFEDDWIRLLLAAAMIGGRLEGVAALMLIKGAFWRT